MSLQYIKVFRFLQHSSPIVNVVDWERIACDVDIDLDQETSTFYNM